MSVTEEYKVIKRMGNKLHLVHETIMGRDILSFLFFICGRKIYVGNYLQREKYSIPYKVKSSGSVYCN